MYNMYGQELGVDQVWEAWKMKNEYDRTRNEIIANEKNYSIIILRLIGPQW